MLKIFENFLRYELFRHFALVLNDPPIISERFLKKKSENENSKVKVKKIKFKKIES